MEDKKFTCCDCKKEFAWTIKEQQFFKDNKIDKEPIRCRDCAIILRDKRQKEAEKEKNKQQKSASAQTQEKVAPAPKTENPAAQKKPAPPSAPKKPATPPPPKK